MSDSVFTVGELNTFIKDVLTSGFPNAVWVCGEIQGFRVDQKGHAYFELCENEDNSHTVKAKIRASIWASRRGFIESVLKRVENTFSLKDDIQVKFLCKVDFWQKGGTISLSVENVDPTYTLGKIAQERQKLIELLKKNGVLEENKKFQLPEVILKIGLITSHDSAAFNDFVDELRLSHFGFQVYLANAVMQGKQAEASVVSALKILHTVSDLDVIVITRGGGSIAELSCFDSEAIARAIAMSSLPVITGIGHEINTTVTDLAAHTYAKTPTAVAQFLVHRVESFIAQLNQCYEITLRYAKTLIEDQNKFLRHQAMVLQRLTTEYFRGHQSELLQKSVTLRRLPLLSLKNKKENLSLEHKNLIKMTKQNFEQAKLSINSFEKLIHWASPTQTLKRGFSITRTKQGLAVRQSDQVKKGQKLTTEVWEGVIQSEVV